MSVLTNSMNITNNPPAKKCYEKCLYSYNYPICSVCAVKIGNSKSFYFSYDISTSNSPVTFNNVDYNVQYIEIYFPSLHYFNNSLTSGELIIYHNGSNGSNLNVCIPIDTSSGAPCPLLNNIFNEINSRQLGKNETIELSLDQEYTINSFVKYAPYFYYLDNKINYVVYGLTDGILITKNILDSMNTILKDNISAPSLQYISNLSYNDKGPYNSAGDEIYIDCQPVDSDGNLLIDKYNKDFYKKFNIGSSSSNVSIIVISVLVSIILLFIIIKLFDLHSLFKGGIQLFNITAPWGSTSTKSNQGPVPDPTNPTTFVKPTRDLITFLQKSLDPSKS